METSFTVLLSLGNNRIFVDKVKRVIHGVMAIRALEPSVENSPALKGAPNPGIK
jgi:hypothetical protein